MALRHGERTDGERTAWWNTSNHCAALRVLEDCAEAVSRSLTSYSSDFLSQAPRSMRTPRHSGLIE